MKLTLLRTVSGDEGTFGQLTLPNGVKLHTGELPWRDNDPDFSCIPATKGGVYACSWAYSPHFGRDIYHVQNVPGRQFILIHPANFMGDIKKGFKSNLEGCIALGMQVGHQGGQQSLMSSRDALAIFENFLNHQPFGLEIATL